MTYRAIGLMSGSSLDGLDLAFVLFDESGGRWSFELAATECIPYESAWAKRLAGATQLNARDYQALHSAYGRHLGESVNGFVQRHGLSHRVQLIGSHGHTTFHDPAAGFTSQLGDGAHLAAVTGINVVSDLRAMDVALGGQGAPIVPVGERLLFPDQSCFLNIGGICNVSFSQGGLTRAWDVCPANRVLNALAARVGLKYDDQGALAASGTVHGEVLEKLNALNYYAQPFPKSLPNEFGQETVLGLLDDAALSVPVALRTCVEHIAVQLMLAFDACPKGPALVTGGGAYNDFLLDRTRALLNGTRELIVPAPAVIEFKEALVMALLAVLRWREQDTVLASVTGASRSSIGGAVWIGQQA